MRLLVDTSVLIDHLRGEEQATEMLIAAVDSGNELWSSTIVRAEVLAGLRPAEERANVMALQGIRWLDVSADVAERAAELARQLARGDAEVGISDCIIAASAEELDARLLTRNVGRYPMLEDMEAPY